MVKLLNFNLVLTLIWSFALIQINAQVPDYINPDFIQQWVLPDGSPAYTGGGTWQQALTGGYDYDGDGKSEFLASYVSEDGNHIWKFFEFTSNATGGYDLTWTYTQTGMSGSLEANQRMITIGDWNNDGDKEVIIGVDPEGADGINLLVFEPNSTGTLPSTPTAELLTPKVSRSFGTAIGVQQRWSWEGPSYVSDINGDGTNEFVGIGLLGVMVARYSGSWSDPNAGDNVVYDYVDSMICVGTTLADLDGNGKKEIVDASPFFFGPAWNPIDSLNDLPGSYHRKDYFVITEPQGGNVYTRSLMMAWSSDSLRKANGYKLTPFNFTGSWHAVNKYDIDNDGREEVFVADWGDGTKGQRFWMIKLNAGQSVSGLDSTNFYELANLRSLFPQPIPDPNHPAGLEIADMNGNGKIELYCGLGPWGEAGGQAVARLIYLGGDPKASSNWGLELVYRDDTHSLVPRQILATNDMTQNGKRELVIVNANAAGGGSNIITLESIIFTNVESDQTNQMDYTLYQNYPNPFNPSTKIEYVIPNEGLVNLQVYNVLGQLVAVLVNEVQTSGKHLVTFNPVNLSSGIYFYKIEAGSFKSVNKMILMK